MKPVYTIRQMGDAYAVDANYMRQIFVARPEAGGRLHGTPIERCEEYIRACQDADERRERAAAYKRVPGAVGGSLLSEREFLQIRER